MKVNCFTISDLDKVFTLDVYQKDATTFLETHLQLDKIYVKSPGAQVHELRMEQDIINLILSDKTVSGPRIFIIVGDAGTGKSEECRLIVEAAKNSGKYDVDHKHKGLLAYGPLAFIGKEEMIYGLLEGSNYEDILIMLLSACKNLLEKKGYGKLWDKIDGKIREGIKYRLAETARSAKKFKEKPEVEIKPFMIVENEDFRPFLEQKESETLVKFLNTRLANVLVALHSDFSSIVGLISHKVEESLKLGKRYLLVMDDVTLLGETFNDILNLITYIGQGGINCDIVCGITRGRYADLSKILDTLSDRAYEIQLTNSNLTYINASWLLDESLAISLIKKYVKAIKDRNRCNLCKSEICKEISSKDLFPFNEHFLINYYNQFRKLAERGSIALTPRFLLATLKDSIKSFLEGKSPANKICQEWEKEEGFIDPARVWLQEDCPEWIKAFIRTCYFYGEVSKEEGIERIKVKKSVIDFFEFDITAVQEYLGVIQDGGYLILSREKIRMEKPKEEGKKETIDFDSVIDGIGRWMKSPNTPFEYAPDVREGFNKLLSGIFKDKLRLVMNPNRLSVKGPRLEWKHRKEDIFPFSIGFSKEKNEIKLVPYTSLRKERSPLTLYVDTEDLVNIIKLKYAPEDVSAALKFITRHPELLITGRKCSEISFSQVPDDFFEWILASLIVLSQINSSFEVKELNVEELYQVIKNALSQKFDVPLLNKLKAMAFPVFTVRDSIIDYVMVKNILAKLINSDLISVVLQFNSEKVESVSSAASIVQEVQDFVQQKIRLVDEEKISNRAKKHQEYVKLSREILEKYQDVKSELEKLHALVPERRLILPEKVSLEEFVDNSSQIEMLANKDIRSKLENLVLLNKIEEINQKYRDTLEFLIQVSDICSHSRTDILERYEKLKKEIESLKKDVDKLIENILHLLGE